MGVYFDIEPATLAPITEEQRLRAVRSYNLLRFRGNQEIDDLVAEAASAYGTPIAAISIITEEQQLFVARTGMCDWDTPRSQSFCSVAIQSPGEPLVVPDAAVDPRFSSKSIVTSQGGIRFYAGVALTDIFGYGLGALCIVDNKPRYDRIDLTILSYLAAEVERVFAV